MKYSIILLLIFFSLRVFSNVDIADATVPSNFHVFNESGNAYVVLKEKGCSGATYYIPANHPKYDTIVSVIIAAQLSNRKVVARFDGCNSNSQGRLVGVYLK